MSDPATVLYGTDVLCLDDIDDPETLVSGEFNRAFALARRLVTPSGAIEEIGDTEPYESMDIREYFGARFRLTDRSVIDEIQTRAASCLRGDPFVTSATVIATYVKGSLSLAAECFDENGNPSNFVLAVDGVTATLLRGG